MHYTVVVDLEMCRVPRRNQSEYHFSCEIIQIGAVILDEMNELVDKFNCFIRPMYGDIDAFIHRLTGISHANIAKGQTFEEVLDRFVEWLPDDSTMVSWSMSDSIQFVREMEEKHISNLKINSLLDSWVDCQAMFSERIDSNRQYRLSEALVAADIETVGREHDGLSDAQNTALLYKKMVTNTDFAINSYYEHMKEETEGLTLSMGDLFKNMDFSNLAVA